jgi:selenide, water dikinase
MHQSLIHLAEADGNRTHLARRADHNGFEDRGAHQDAYASTTHAIGSSARLRRAVGTMAPRRPRLGSTVMTAVTATTYRLTQYAHGGGCACKIPPGELEAVVAGLFDTGPVQPVGELLVGLADGDDAAVVRLEAGTAVVATADFFTPVVDDAFDWGRIAAANALSDVYAMGGTPVVGVNLLSWPREVLPFELAREVLRGGVEVARSAGCHVAGGHSVDDPEPKYGMAVTGLADPNRLLRNDAGRSR